MDDERLIDVVKEIKRLRKEISDKQWKNKEATFDEKRLQHFENLAREGEFYEPNF